MAIRGRYKESEKLATLGSSLSAHGAELTLLEWAARLACSRCGSQEVDFVVSGERR